MFKKTNKILSAVLVVLFIASLMTNSAFAMNNNKPATTNSGIQPRWANVVSATIILDVTQPTIYVGTNMGGPAGTTYRNGTVVLEKISGSNCGVVEIWEDLSSNLPLFQFNDTSVAPTSGTYRLTITIDAIRNGVSETIEISKESSC
ncbi:MAG: hypothetical protein IKL40_04780 [Clostridia bacterium]|nr:hypothetical protein [Clostridia bacterium]